MLEFKSKQGTNGRGWVSNDGTWEIAMMGMGRYWLFHLTPTRTRVGAEYVSFSVAREWATRLADMLAKVK